MTTPSPEPERPTPRTKAVLLKSLGLTMPVEDLIQLIRTCNLAQVRATLECWNRNVPKDYELIQLFYQVASTHPK